MNIVHELKCYTDRFEHFQSGICKADIRFNDRTYTIGDTLFMYEGYQDKGEFIHTNRIIAFKITYIDVYAVQQGFVVLSLEKLC